jgi:hypothetical protein
MIGYRNEGIDCNGGNEKLKTKFSSQIASLIALATTIFSNLILEKTMVDFFLIAMKSSDILKQISSVGFLIIKVANPI